MEFNRSPLDMPLEYLRRPPKGLAFKIHAEIGHVEIERDDNTRLSIENKDWKEGDWSTYMRILNFLMGKLVDDSKLLLSSGGEFASAERIRELNAELDIARGVSPTPPGYVISPERTKSAMAELKRLLEAQNG